MAELLFQSKQEKLPDGSPIIITKILGAIDGTTVRQFEDKLIGFFNQGVKNLILIFSDVRYINSTGMGLLVKLADKFQEGGGDIKLVGVPEKVIALFDMLGLLSLFKIYETEEDAVDSIAQSDGPKASPGGGIPAPPPPPPPLPPKPVAPPAPVRPAPPRPQPQPVSTSQNDDLMGGGIEIGGGFEIAGEDDLLSTPAAPVSWPYEANCSHCNGPIQFGGKGNFRCPRCSSFITIDEYGQQTVHASVSSRLVELKYSCDMRYANGIKASVDALALQVGFSNVFCEEINVALDHALAITVEKGKPSETFQILAVADSNEMIVGVKSLNPFLVQGGPRDSRLPQIARKVNRLEVFPLPNKGQLLKITKKRK